MHKSHSVVFNILSCCLAKFVIQKVDAVSMKYVLVKGGQNEYNIYIFLTDNLLTAALRQTQYFFIINGRENAYEMAYCI